jgi:sulfite exporter TauE/SafE
VEFTLVYAFISGFLGGFGHCIGMCGPIVTTYTLHEAEGLQKRNFITSVFTHLIFNAGRTTTYVFIGALMGFTGSFVNTAAKLANIQNVASFGAGLFMMLMGLAIAGVFKKLLAFEKYNAFILKIIKEVLKGASIARYIPLGMLVGTLPCGLSYSIFIASAGTGSMMMGMGLAFVFGISSSISLIFFGLFFNVLGMKLRGILYRISGIVLFLMGVYFIYKAVVS